MTYYHGELIGSPARTLRPDPRCFTWATIAVTVAGAAVSVGAGAAVGAATKPNQPDLASSSKELSDVNAHMLPLRRQLESAAQTGGKVTIQDWPQHEEQGQFYEVPGDYEISGKKEFAGLMMGVPGFGFLGKDKGERTQFINVKEWEPGGKYAGQPKPSGQPVQKSFTVPAGPKTFDFTGVGAADANAVVAKASAEAQLALQQKYGVDFAKSNAEQAKLADPNGYAAREKMASLIQDQINRKPDRTIANTLDAQVGDQLNAGSGLTMEEKQLLDDSVRSAGGARGGVSAADFSDPLTSGFAGEARAQAGIQKAGGWLASKLTPQDADYRTEQQNMSNLSALVNGRTPESQFQSLSAPGATPFTPGQSLPQMPTNSTTAGQSNALSSYAQQTEQAQQQVNPWMAGLSGLLSAGNAYVAGKN